MANQAVVVCVFYIVDTWWTLLGDHETPKWQGLINVQQLPKERGFAKAVREKWRAGENGFLSSGRQAGATYGLVRIPNPLLA